jgi:hypothetical protein
MKNQKQAGHGQVLLKMELKILRMPHQHGNKYYFHEQFWISIQWGQLNQVQ